jgi:ATP-dependent Clp protease ATP-binding subunit ClpC
VPETPNAPHGSRTCSECGERPATLGVLLTDGEGRTTRALCEPCARRLFMEAGIDPTNPDPQQPGFPPPGFGAFRRGPGERPDGPDGGGEPPSKTPALDQFGRDLTADAAEGRIDPVIGRAAEVEQTVEILARRRKNNAVLIGEPGVGKTAIAEGLARRIAEGDVPATLQHARLVALDLAGMIAGAQFRGQFEQRMKAVLTEVRDSEGRIVLFVDELHTILGAGNAEGAMDAASILKPMLARGELRVIGATTLSEYKQIERDGALARRFSPVMVEEPSVEETIEILDGLRSAYEEHHGLEIAEAALVAAAKLSDRYLSEQRLPDKAIDLVDQAAARVRLRAGGGEDIASLEAAKDGAAAAEEYERAAQIKVRIERLREQGAGEPSVVGEEDVAAVVAGRTGIPVGELVAGELQRLQDLEGDLHERVVGQDEAVEIVADTIRRARVGLAEGDRPLGTFLFLGPTGVGKTELVKALAERLFATEKSLVRIDMSEYREPHTVARLIGSPPGYVGYGEGGQLTEPVRRRPYSVVLLDEIEKAHPDVWNVLLQLMDDGRLTDGEGRTVDFSNTVVVMTSNLGAGRARRGVGFTAAAPEAEEERMRGAAKSAFLPEFINRIDETVTFRPLTAGQVEEIAGLMVERVAERLQEERGIALEATPALIARLATEGFDEEYGARPLQRHVRRTLERELTRAILDGRLPDGASVTADAGDEGEITLAVEPAEPAKALPVRIAA